MSVQTQIERDAQRERQFQQALINRSLKNYDFLLPLTDDRDLDTIISERNEKDKLDIDFNVSGAFQVKVGEKQTGNISLDEETLKKNIKTFSKNGGANKSWYYVRLKMLHELLPEKYKKQSFDFEKFENDIINGKHTYDSYYGDAFPPDSKSKITYFPIFMWKLLIDTRNVGSDEDVVFKIFNTIKKCLSDNDVSDKTKEMIKNDLVLLSTENNGDLLDSKKKYKSMIFFSLAGTFLCIGCVAALVLFNPAGLAALVLIGGLLATFGAGVGLFATAAALAVTVNYRNITGSASDEPFVLGLLNIDVSDRIFVALHNSYFKNIMENTGKTPVESQPKSAPETNAFPSKKDALVMSDVRKVKEDFEAETTTNQPKKASKPQNK